MSIFSRVAEFFSPSPATVGPKVGDKVWWRGLLMEVKEVLDRGSDQIVRYSHVGGRFRCASAASEFYRDPVSGFWMLPGCEGSDKPKLLRGELVIPDAPACKTCGDVTWREDHCTNCRLQGRV